MSELVDQLGIPEPATPEEVAAHPVTPTRRAIKRLVRNPVAILALGYVLLMIAVAIFAPLIAPHDPNVQNGLKFESPSGKYLLGTDQFGRDILSRLIWGTRVSVRAGFQTIAMATLIAVPLGLLAGYVGGLFDNGTQRVMDAFQSFPALVLALAIAAVLGPSLDNAIIAITIVFIPGLVRLVRAQSLAVRQETFVEASHSIGTRTHTVLRKRILPGVLTALIVAISLGVGGALLAEAGLGFLGLGVQPPDASWGSMLKDGFGFIYTEPQMIFIPGVALALAILAFNLLGDAINDALGQGHGPPKRQKRSRRGQRQRRRRFGLTEVRVAESNEQRPVPEAILSVRDLQGRVRHSERPAHRGRWRLVLGRSRRGRGTRR